MFCLKSFAISEIIGMKNFSCRIQDKNLTIRIFKKLDYKYSFDLQKLR